MTGNPDLPPELTGCEPILRKFTDEDYATLIDLEKVRALTSKAACLKKRPLSEADATTQARIDSQRHGEDMHAYPCNRGPHWHVGHKPRLRL